MKSLVPWHRSQRAELRSRFDQWFDQFFADPWGTWTPSLLGNGQGDLFAPRVEVRESDDQVLVRAELPGVDAKDVEVELVENVVVLTGKKEDTREEKHGEATFSEFRFGSFRREIALPAEVDPDSVKASCERGILTIQMEKTKASRARRIPVESR